LCTLTLNLHIHRGSWWILIFLFFYGPITDGDFTLQIRSLLCPAAAKSAAWGLDWILKMPQITQVPIIANGRNEFTLSRQFAGNYYPIRWREQAAKQ